MRTTSVAANEMPTPIRVDDELVLRRLIPDDAEALFDIIEGDTDIRHNVSWPASVHSLDSARKGIERLLRENEVYNPYVLQENGVTIGYVGTWSVKDKEVGFSYFLDKDSRGQGFATRAVNKLIETANQNMPVDTFIVNITEANAPSRAIASKLGFRPTDIFMEDSSLLVQTRRYERPAL